MTDPYEYNNPKRLFELWKELTGEDLLPDEWRVNINPKDNDKGQIRSKSDQNKKRR